MKIGSPLTLDLTNTRAFKTWLHDLWRSTGGDTTTITTIDADLTALELAVGVLEVDVSSLQNDVSALQSNQVLTKQTIVDLGPTYIQDKTVNVIDADITATSLIECSIAPVASGYTRPVEEVIYERIMVYATPKAGSIDFYLQPERGHFKGEFVINYMVAL
jgi:hypothetical protein